MPRVLFLDCDDCLYQNNWRTEARITTSIKQYMQSIGLAPELAFEMYQKFGTTLKGLLSEGLLSDAEAEAFLVAAHDVSYCDIIPDPALAEVCSCAASRTHTRRSCESRLSDAA